ncbi:MAG: molybdate ABC transporter permease subunit [Anaerofustis sp.]
MNLSPLYISLKVSLIATVLTFFLGIAAARWVVKIRHGKAFVDGFFTLPMILPPTVAGFFLLLVFGRNSLIGQFLGLFDVSIVFTWVAAVIASTVVSFPLMYRTVRGALEEIDSDMIFAARTLGVAENQIFRKIVLPNIVPSIMAGTILAFARALGEFGATIMLAGNIPGKTQTMAVAVYTAVQAGNYTLAYQWVAIITVMSFVAMFLMNFINQHYMKKNHKRGNIG